MHAITQAEAIYSESRLRALADEWSSDYPNLFELGLFLKKFPKQFIFHDIKERVEECMLEFLTTNAKYDYLHILMREKFDTGDIYGFMQEMFRILFRVGIVGVKSETYLSTIWSYRGEKLLEDIDNDVVLYIHPAFWRILGIPLT